MLMVVVAPLPAFAQVSETATQTMPFEACISSIQRVSGQLGAAPINVVETSDLRVVRFCTADGSVLVSCSRPDQKMVMSKSAKRC